MPTVLVTGAAGFIGLPLVRELLGRGLEVAALDDFSVGSRAKLEELRDGEPLHVFEADVRDREGTLQAVAEASPEAVVHLAALHFIPDCVARPADTLAINVSGTRNVLDAAHAAGVGRIVFASTGAVYAPDDAPRREFDPTRPGNIYGASKLIGEWLLDYQRARDPGLTAHTARLFNVYGPGETNPHVLAEVLAQLRNGDTLRLGNVEASRDYVFVDDVATVLAELALRSHSTGRLNVASGTAITVEEAVERLRRITGRPLEIVSDPERLRAADRPVLAADVTRLRQLLPGLELTEFDEGLRRSLAAEGLLEP